MKQPRLATSMVASVLIGTTALVGPLTGSAHATPNDDSGTVESTPLPGDGTIHDVIPTDTLEEMIAQAPLVDAASVIRTAVEATPGRGYAGVGLVDDHVTLWWKGEPPADIAEAVEAAGRTAQVEVAEATYSRAELSRAAAELTPVVTDDPSGAAHAVRVRTDGSGIEIAVDGAEADVPELPATGVNVEVVTEERMTERSRTDDPAPFDGGTGIGPTGPWCTAGFGVTDRATGDGYILSAEHCGTMGQAWHTAWDQNLNTGRLIGHTVAVNADHDTMLISTAWPGDHIYIGGQHDELRAQVIGWTEVFPGQLLCQSGYTSAGVLGGPVCNLRVEFHYEDIEDLVEATQLDGEDSARGGDSGGPVYAVNGDGTVLAAGTTTRAAGPGFGFQDFATARDDFGDIVPATAAETTCRVSYVVTDSWGTGYAASVTVYNDGPAVDSWSVGWTFPGGQLIEGRWHGVFQQTGAAVTVTNESHNGSISTGGAMNFGFTAAGSPTNPAPFTLNGAVCA